MKVVYRKANIGGLGHSGDYGSAPGKIEGSDKMPVFEVSRR